MKQILSGGINKVYYFIILNNGNWNKNVTMQKKSIDFNLTYDMHVLCEIHQEATSWILFYFIFSSVSFGQSVTDVPCQAISFLSLYLWPHSVVPFSLGDLSLLWVCYRVCLSSVCLSAGAAVQSPNWVMKACAIYSGQGGRERRWDVSYRHNCKGDLWQSQMFNKKWQKN